MDDDELDDVLAIASVTAVALACHVPRKRRFGYARCFDIVAIMVLQLL